MNSITPQKAFASLQSKVLFSQERALRYANHGEMDFKKAFILGALGALASGDAFATATATAGTSPLVQVKALLCEVTNALQGPLGWAIIICCIVVAGLSLAVGGKKSSSILIGSMLGAVIVFGAKTTLAWAAGSTPTGTC